MKRASEAPFPYGYGDGSVCYFTLRLVDEIQVPIQLPRFRATFRLAVEDAIKYGTTIYAVWPGQYRSDLFVIDKPELLAEAIGLVAA